MHKHAIMFFKYICRRRYESSKTLVDQRDQPAHPKKMKAHVSEHWIGPLECGRMQRATWLASDVINHTALWTLGWASERKWTVTAFGDKLGVVQIQQSGNIQVYVYCQLNTRADLALARITVLSLLRQTAVYRWQNSLCLEPPSPHGSRETHTLLFRAS